MPKNPLTWVFILTGWLVSLEGNEVANPYCQAFEAKQDTFYHHYQEGHYQASVEAAQALLQYAEQQWGAVSIERVEALNKVIMAYNGTGQYQKVLPLAATAKRLIAQTTGKANREYHILNNSLGYAHLQLGRLERAKAIYQKAIRLEDKYWDRAHPLKIALYKNMGNVYNQEGHIKKAREWYRKALTVAEKRAELDSRNVLMNYFTALMKLGETYEETAQAGKAEKYYREAKRHFAHHLSKDHGRYSKILLRLGNCYHERAKYQQAQSTLTQALSHVEQELGKKHPRYLKCLSALASTYQEQQKPRKALSYFKKGNTAARILISNKFALLSEAGKADFIRELRPFFQRFNSFSAAYHQQYPELPRLAYDNVLLLKGLVLRSMQNLRQGTDTTQEQQRAEAFQEWQNLHQAIGRQMALAPNERRKSLDSLKQAADQLERKLVRHTGEQDQQNLETIAPVWQEVGNRLNEEEAALEFVTYRPDHKQFDKERYGALILKGGEPTVTFVPLMFTGALKKRLPAGGADKRSSIDSLYQWQYYGSSLYRGLWAPLQDHLKEMDKVYLSPVRELHKLSFKALPIDNQGQRLTHRYDLLSVNSTGDLTQSLTAQLEEVTMFGGIRYAYNRDTANKPSSTTPKLALNDLQGYQQTRAVKERFAFLEGSLAEVNQIYQRLTKADISVKLLKGQQASEAAFKQLDGESPEVLHVSTHGFCFSSQPDRKAKRNRASALPYQKPKHPLLRSGLVMAGGNYAWQHGQNPYEAEDGILTAYEIAGLDLSETDVVVLSACETGLGEIRGSEGVYGLQRAFRMAGVDHLILSLWSVPDKPTRALMTRFYQNWESGQPLQQAFDQAQARMAEQYPPYCWAGFQLIGSGKMVADAEAQAQGAFPVSWVWIGGGLVLVIGVLGLRFKRVMRWSM